MSNVTQLRNTGGFTRMDNDLLDALASASFTITERKVIDVVIRLTAGYQRSTARITGREFETRTGKKRNHVSEAVDSLLRRNVLFRIGGSAGEIGINEPANWTDKLPTPKTGQCPKIGTDKVREIGHLIKKERNIAPSELVDAQRQPEQVEQISIPVRQVAKVEACPHTAIVDLYHEVLPELPGVALLNKTRQQHLQSRWREHSAHRDLGFWREFFESVKSSDFLMGKVQGRNGGKPFRATFDWLICPSNFVKVVEGNYHA